MGRPSVYEYAALATWPIRCRSAGRPRAAGPVHATVSLPGSKSLTNRALVLAALAGCSTMGVYSRFGSKDGVVTAILATRFPKGAPQGEREMTLADLMKQGKAGFAAAMEMDLKDMQKFGDKYKKGMEEMSEKFRERGAEIYLPTLE